MRALKGERRGGVVRGGKPNARSEDPAPALSVPAGLDHAAGRYHAWQSDPARDTAAKRLARAVNLAAVRCPCGELHPSAVRRGGRG